MDQVSMRFGLVFILALLLFNSSAQHNQAGLHHLPNWIHELFAIDGTHVAIPPTTRRVHTNSFIGKWEIHSMGTRYLYWADTTRCVLQVFGRNRDLPNTILADLHTDIRVAMSYYSTYTGEGHITISDLEETRYPWPTKVIDSLVTTGSNKQLLAYPALSYSGSMLGKTGAHCWLTTEEPELLRDMHILMPWLSTGELSPLRLISDIQVGLALELQCITTRNDTILAAFTSIEHGRFPMPAQPLIPNYIDERRTAWRWNKQIGRLPAWVREQLSNLPPDTAAENRTPTAKDLNIPDNKFIGNFTAKSPSSRFTINGIATRPPSQFSYWADARRASLMRVDNLTDTSIYIVDLNENMRLYGSTKSPYGPKIAIWSLDSLLHMEDYGDGLVLELEPTGSIKVILGVECEQHVPKNLPSMQELPDPTYWFSNVDVRPTDDMVHWMNQRKLNEFAELMLFAVAGMPFPFQAAGTTITTFHVGYSEPPFYSMSNWEPIDHR